MNEPIRLWRIAQDTPDYEAHDLSGKGAELTGGRWNRPGTPLVYASTSRALACLETLVHLGSSALPLNRYLVEIQVPAPVWSQAVPAPSESLMGWDALPAGRVSLSWGTDWATSGASLLAKVPSILVPEEHNVLINPRHPDGGRLLATKVRKWTYDARLLGQLRPA